MKTTKQLFDPIIERYTFDFDVCSSKKGWTQYDTKQDASYFGIWVHIEKRKVLTFCEGDITIDTYSDLESFREGLESMGEFYGEAPPALKMITADGTMIHYFDERPKA